MSSVVENFRLNPRNAISMLIEECMSMRELKQIHTQIIRSPYLHHDDQPSLLSRLLFFCALSDSGSLGYAHGVFRLTKNPNLFVYNIMIRALASKPEKPCSFESLSLYKRMLREGIVPNCLTFPFILKDCAHGVGGFHGRCLHGQAIRFGFSGDVFVRNSLVNMYSASGFLGIARGLFDEMPERDFVSWNSVIFGYLKSGDLDEALSLFRAMGSKNVVTWNSMITGFVHGGRAKEALELFQEMQVVNHEIRPDKVTISSVISACARLGAIDHGTWVHGYLRRSGHDCDVVISTALVDMYGKCGSVEQAYNVFKEIPEKDTLAYTAMISVFALHGYSKEAFDVFAEMEKTGVMPNHVTFVGLLSACSHSGLISKSLWCLDAMKRVHMIEPKVYHFACVVDVLSRAGLFEEAERVITEMPMKPDVFVWGALLGGCQMHGNVALGERVATYLIDLDPLNHAFYLNLCDIYAKSGRFEKLRRVRRLMKERRVKKEIVGCSLIEIHGVVYEFSVRGSHDVEMTRIQLLLDVLKKDITGNWLVGL